MTQTPDIPHDPDALHRWVHEQLAAYLAGGLDPRERAALENHIHACPPCFDAFTDARHADLAVLRHLGGDHGLSASDHLEERLLQHLRETTMKRTSFARLAGMSIAAAVALAAAGVLANHLVQNDRLSNPLTEHLTAQLPGLPLWLGGARPQRI